MIQDQINVTQRREILNKAKIQLKKEFVGIDGIIDEVLDIILPWWLFPQHQMRPLIVNLWGMTGSGKTALIKRLSELLKYENYLMRFDMGEFGSNSSFLKYTLTRQLNQFNATVPIIVLDEFQFAKTIDENGKEVNNNALRIIWDLLDSGELSYEPDGSGYYLSMCKKGIQILKAYQKRGAVIKKGKITLLADEMFESLYKYFKMGYEASDVERPEGVVPFKEDEALLTDIFCTGIYEINTENFENWKAVAAEIRNFNSIQEVIDFITDLIDKELAFKKMDLSKSLIFVVGNLDEAFAMSGNINPDIDADEYRRYTLRINISDIKTALQRRFRHEQIARLGNNHLIYTAFSHKNFEQLIKLLVSDFAKRIKTRFKLKVTFTKATYDFLYAEGVFPTQGVRPVMSTVRNFIESNIAKIILEVFEQKAKIDSLNWDFNGDQFVVDLISAAKIKNTIKLPVIQKINSLRKSTKNDLQSLVAVHEAGHTLAAMLLVGILPEYVITKTADSESQGFAYFILPEEIETRRLLLDRIKIGLGGYVAEQLIFGKENNTTGVSGDLFKLTGIAHQIIREYGMNDEPYKMNIHQYGGNPFQFTFTEAHEAAAKEIVMECFAEVKETISTHKKFLLMIANHLSDNSRMEKEQLEEMAKVYFTKNKIAPVKFISPEQYYDFRKVLKSLV
jgi:Peptidase family M41/C-terminal, D2-small domain, of ClpB protein